MELSILSIGLVLDVVYCSVFVLYSLGHVGVLCL